MLKTSALDNAGWLPQELHPPAASTVPSGSTVAVAPNLASFIDPVVLHLPVAGSYSSALASELPPSAADPPVTRTSPSGSSAATASCLAVLIEPVAFQAFVAGLYSWAAAVPPPVTSTWPSASSVAVTEPPCETADGPVLVQVALAGLYTSAGVVTPKPVTSTLPLGSGVAVRP